MNHYTAQAKRIYAEEAEQARVNHVVWELVRNSLLSGESWRGMSLNARLEEEYDWAIAFQNVPEFPNYKTAMQYYLANELNHEQQLCVEREADTLASVIVGADHE